MTPHPTTPHLISLPRPLTHFILCTTTTTSFFPSILLSSRNHRYNPSHYYIPSRTSLHQTMQLFTGPNQGVVILIYPRDFLFLHLTRMYIYIATLASRMIRRGIGGKRGRHAHRLPVVAGCDLVPLPLASRRTIGTRKTRSASP